MNVDQFNTPFVTLIHAARTMQKFGSKFSM